MGNHTRLHHWSYSKFADFIRGTPTPRMGLTSKGQRIWNQKAKNSHPIRFWIANTGLRKLQNFVSWPMDTLGDLNNYIVNRFVYHTHALVAHRTNITPGQYVEPGDRVLYCLFDMLVDYVEIELAQYTCAYDATAREQFNPPWSVFGFRKWRCPEAGLHHLDWEISLLDDFPESDNYGQPSHQSINASEIKELYLWYTTIFKNRPDPDDASGWTAYCEIKYKNGGDFKFDDINEDDRRQSSKIIAESMRIEEDYERENTEMLTRLIKVRMYLST